MRLSLPLSVVLLVLAAASAAPAAPPIRTTARDPVFSPDGRTIAFARWSTAPAIMLVGVDGRRRRALVPNVFATDVAWSPDGSSLVYAAGGEIWRADVATGATQRLTQGAAGADLSWQPSWSPDGKLIAWDASSAASAAQVSG